MKKSIKIILTSILILFLLGVGVGLFYYNWVLHTPISSMGSDKIFEIKTGEGSFEIASRLQDSGIIRSDLAFYLDSKIKNKNLQVGVYKLSGNMSIIQIFDIISSGKTALAKITIPEGYRAEQIGQVLAEKKLIDYADFVKASKPYEGKLFPDTYYFSPKDSVNDIILEMTKDYENRTSAIVVTSEDLIIASIVEREADNETERPIIAGIYKNRLRAGMKLQSDPTVGYAKDNIILENLSVKEQENYTFWHAITNADFLTAADPYNTYLSTGLPPGPICNPGIASIEATLNSTPSNYYYFIVANDQAYGAVTYAEHQQNVVKYLN